MVDRHTPDNARGFKNAMAEFQPVRTVDDFRTLDDGEMLEGYLDGFDGQAPPDSTRSRSYWHGWRNGMVDSARCPPDQAYLALGTAFSDKVTLH